MKRIKLNISMLAFIVVSMVLGITSCKDKDVVLNSIALNKTTATIALNGTELLNVVYTPTDATFKDLTWTSSNTSVATVADGLVTGVTAGTVTITATSTVDPAITATCAVTVSHTAGPIVTVTGDITSNTTWNANTLYKLSGFVYVKNNATLTIEPGTIITGVVDTKGSLIIERGSKIMAQGTAAKPIVFTSDKAVGHRDAGDWGGLVLCGKALTNQTNGGSAGDGLAEGGIGSDYGGTDDNDNSGVLQYVRIEFAGIALTTTANSEINGLTLYAVGKSTTIDHIQVSYSGDDSYEWFGGNVNCKYLIAYSGVDDDFDTDNGFSGTVQFGLGLRNPSYSDIVSKSNGFESDNDAGGSTTTPITKPIFCNMTMCGPLASVATLPGTHYFKSSMHIRRGSRLSVYNSVFVGWPDGLRIDGGAGDTPAQADADVVQIENCILAGMVNNYANVTTNATGFTSAQTLAYFESVSPARNNLATTLATAVPSLLNLTNPTLLPAVGSTLLSGGAYTNARLSGNAFLDKTGTYRGAFGSVNWTTGWTNFDPKNTIY
jgi:hypothetical protein